MTNYRRAIVAAIKAAGFKVEEFEIHNTGFEPNWHAAGLAGKHMRDYTDEDEKTTKAQNRKVAKVAKALVAAGHRATTYTAAHGGRFVEVNEYRHAGHAADFNEKHSVYHY
jgi:hypothetical protein